MIVKKKLVALFSVLFIFNLSFCGLTDLEEKAQAIVKMKEIIDKKIKHFVFLEKLIKEHCDCKLESAKKKVFTSLQESQSQLKEALGFYDSLRIVNRIVKGDHLYDDEFEEEEKKIEEYTEKLFKKYTDPELTVYHFIQRFGGKGALEKYLGNTKVIYDTLNKYLDAQKKGDKDKKEQLEKVITEIIEKESSNKGKERLEKIIIKLPTKIAIKIGSDIAVKCFAGLVGSLIESLFARGLPNIDVILALVDVPKIEP